MLLLISSLFICQNTNTANIKCIPETQIPEIFKGLKQGEYLKARLEKTEKIVNESQLLISEQKSIITKQNQIIIEKDNLIANNSFISDQEKILKESEISVLKADFKILQIESKKTSRKKFWNGVKIGGVSVAVLGVAGIFLIK